MGLTAGRSSAVLGLLLLTGCPFITDADLKAASDRDGDGYPALEAGGTDCDDALASVHPLAEESCNNLDDDCDGGVDTPAPVDALTFYDDLDGDGYGDPSGVLLGCSAPEGASDNADDCDDTRPTVHPGAEEACDGEDQDCDGEADNGAVGGPWYLDADGDGYGDGLVVSAECLQQSGYVGNGDDCDDDNAEIWPGADELCDGLDGDCDGEVDEDAVDAPTWYADLDGDLFGDPDAGSTACEAPTGAVALGTDCDDADAATFPGGVERCGGGDENCDGAVDENTASDAPTWYTDTDGDGYGASGGVIQCEAPAGRVLLTGDCNEAVEEINPGATESCNRADDDCDGTVDEPDAIDATTWYEDLDGDGHGVVVSSVIACDMPADHAALGDDCDDADPAVSPSALEVCGGADEDCDGVTDETDASDTLTWYLDSDADGAGDAASTRAGCVQYTGYVADAGDCDDADPDIGPLADERCNTADDDCDGTVDEADAIDAPAWYPDLDGDSFGDAAAASTACTAPVGYIAAAEDCDDTDAAINPDAAEICDDGVDDNCDGGTDSCRLTGNLGLGSADATYTGSTDGEQAGFSLDSVDGFNDTEGLTLVIGAPAYASSLGALWLVEPGSGEVALGVSTAVRVAGLSSGTHIEVGVGTVTVGPGDFNNNGDLDLVIGSPKGNYSGSDSGAAHVLFGPVPSGTTTSSSSIHFYGETTGAEAGAAIAGGSLDTDSRVEIVVGAPGESSMWTGGGAAYINDYGGTGWKQLSTATSRVWGDPGEELGTSVAVTDLDGDGQDDLAVGLPGQTSVTPGGAVRVYLGPISGDRVASDADADVAASVTGALLGTVMASIDDQDGDGLAELWVGAPEHSTSEAGIGQAVLYAWDGGLVEQGDIQGVLRGDGVGSSVDDAGDVDGDGLHDLLIGSATTSTAWLQYGPLTGTVVTSDADLSLAPDGESIGGAMTVCGAGDTNSDGFDDLLLGLATSDSGGLTSNGAVYLVYGGGD